MTHIVFLPGFMCDGRLFELQIRTLRSRGYSCSVGNLTGSISIEGMADNVIARAPQRFALIGLSMGGIVAMEIATRVPERVSHLALLNTTPHADKSQTQRKSQLCRVAEGGLAMVLRDELKPNYMAEVNRTNERLKLLADMGTRFGEAVFASQSIALMRRRSYLDVLSTIHCPTLVMGGQEDTVCPPQLHFEMAEKIPQAALQLLARCGHLSPIEQGERVSEALVTLIRADTPVRSHSVNHLKLVQADHINGD